MVTTYGRGITGVGLRRGRIKSATLADRLINEACCTDSTCPGVNSISINNGIDRRIDLWIARFVILPKSVYFVAGT